MKRWIAGSALAVLLALGATGVALAQAAFPTKPIRILVPFPPGGGTDVAARALAEHFGKELGQPTMVENRPGGNSIIASEAVAEGGAGRPHAAAHDGLPLQSTRRSASGCRTTR